MLLRNEEGSRERSVRSACNRSGEGESCDTITAEKEHEQTANDCHSATSANSGEWHGRDRERWVDGQWDGKAGNGSRRRDGHQQRVAWMYWGQWIVNSGSLVVSVFTEWWA